MLYNKEDQWIFNVHIPRTGGRFIQKIFVKNSFDFYFSDYTKHFQGIEIPHLHYPLYLNLEQVEECDHHFTTVRNPFDRFKSCMQLVIRSRGYPIEIYEKIKDKDWLFNFIEMEKTGDSYFTNLFRNQKDFISEKTKIWRLESGLGHSFIRWLNENFNLSLEDIDYQKDYLLGGAEILPIKKEIDSSIENFIKEYYMEDYNAFNY